jgi:hypothetical protein
MKMKAVCSSETLVSTNNAVATRSTVNSQSWTGHRKPKLQPTLSLRVNGDKTSYVHTNYVFMDLTAKLRKGKKANKIKSQLQTKSIISKISGSSLAQSPSSSSIGTPTL